VRMVLDARSGQLPIGVHLIFSKGRMVFVADTIVHEFPTPDEMCDIAIQTAGVARRFGHEPRVAFLSNSTFGFPPGERSMRVIEAVRMMDERKVDFEYDGEMTPDVALDREKMTLYPFARLSDVANVLIMPAILSASISTKLLAEVGGVTTMGPLLVGLDKSVQIAPLGAKMSEIYNMAVLAAYDINR
jgi:malate dehydrogenase (oxaloacetate-decarboxylating)(NADP+)